MPAILRIAEAWAATYPGRKRGPNQDSVLLGENVLRQGQCTAKGETPFALAVADGVSGDPGGEVASELAVSALRGHAPRTLPEAVELLESAGALIHQAGSGDSGMRNMCTTLAAVWVFGDRIVWCTRGDTPIYFVTDRRVMQVSHPHTDVFGCLTSYLGADSVVSLATTDGAVVTHGLGTLRAVAVMSDGISGFVDKAQLRRLAAAKDEPLSKLGMSLMRRAFANDSYDNLSFVMARIAREV